MILWDASAMQGVRDAKLEAPIVARALAVPCTCTYDAWAAYDNNAVGTQLSGALRRHGSERTEANKERAISFAAYRALTDVLPVDTESVYKPLMRELGYDPNDNSTDIETPAASATLPAGQFWNIGIMTSRTSWARWIPRPPKAPDKTAQE